MRSAPAEILVSLLLLTCFPLWVFAGIFFDGIDDIVNCGSDASLDGHTTISVSAWVFSDDFSVGTDDRVASKANDAGTLGWSWRVDETTVGKIFLVIPFSGVDGFWEVTSPVLAEGVWSHIAFTYDNSSTANNPLIYINGVSETVTETQTPTGTVSADDAFDFLIGNDGDFNRQFFGQITEVAYWSTVLTQAGVTQLANSRIKGMPLQIQPSSLAGYWPLNDEEDSSSADGDTFLDLSSNTNNGTGSDGANNTGLTAKAEEVLSY